MPTHKLQESLVLSDLHWFEIGTSHRQYSSHHRALEQRLPDDIGACSDMT